MSILIKKTNFNDSGIEWIGNIPINWSTSSVRNYFEITLGKMVQPDASLSTDVLIKYLKAMHVQDGFITTTKVAEMYATARERELLSLKKGDLLVCEGGEVARSAIVKENLINYVFQNSLHRVRSTNNGFNGYLHYLLVSLRNSGYIDILVNKATIAHFTKDKFNSLKVCIPPIEEQKKIFDFIKNKENQILDLISSKEIIINLLEEKRQAMITEAVTRGLNPHVKMKNSGVEWIGEIPEHWEVIALKRLSKRIEVGIAEAATHAYRDSGVPIIRSTNIKNGKINQSNLLYIVEEFAEKNKSKFIFKNDLLTVRTGNAGLTGVVPSNLDYSQCFTMLITTLKANINPYFYSYYLNALPGKAYFEITAWGTAQKNISVPILQECPVLKVDVGEQNKIVEFISSESEKLEKLINNIGKQIKKLKEYRQSLIYEAVTGKIGVHDFEVVK